ncbi:MAG: sigma-54-dependent Fis family transcriptional regulator [Steroidobacteraceae bacterium]|jgi:transcriptional regulator of acetoin/glycerol metabolism
MAYRHHDPSRETAALANKLGPHADLVLRVAAHGAAALEECAVTPAVNISWRRCLNDFKLDPARDYQPVVRDHNRVAELRAQHEDLVQIARAEMDSLYHEISGSGYALLLADTDGVILCEKVDPILKGMFAQAGLIVGAEWSERSQGTNGIGTCAAEGRAITIHESDHFRSRHAGLSCSAAPVHDPDGRLLAVLDASSVNAGGTRASKLHTVALVNASARSIEKCLFLRRHSADMIVHFHDRPELVDLAHHGAIAIGPDGTVTAADSKGVELLGAKHRAELVGHSIEEIFDTTHGELLTASTAEPRSMCDMRATRHGRRYFASVVGGAKTCASAASASRQSVHPVCRDRRMPVTLEDLAGGDPQMQRNARNARRIADKSVPVVIRGPTGSGKEAFAKALHLASNRSKQPFVAVNCAAIPEALIESELFGYVSGAFTGARREGMRGRIVQANGGTLFLDEIGDMPLALQTRLLRVLEELEVIPLGAGAPVKVDIRIMCASHRNLTDMMARGEFREDLYYRLNGICIELPPLAARKDKHALIMNCMAHESGGESAAIETAALHRLLSHSWPGNIRELRSTLRTALAICDDRIVRLGDLPAGVRRPQLQAPAESGQERSSGSISLAGAERQALIRVMEQNNWNMTRVAAHLRVSRNTLYRKIKRHGIRIARYPNL